MVDDTGQPPSNPGLADAQRRQFDALRRAAGGPQLDFDRLPGTFVTDHKYSGCPSL